MPNFIKQGLTAAAKQLGKAWSKAAKSEGAELLRYPVHRFKSDDELAYQLGAQLENEHDLGKGYIMAGRGQEGMLDPRYWVSYVRPSQFETDFLQAASAPPHKFYSPEEIELLQSKALPRSGFVLYRTPRIPANRGIGSELYRYLFDSMPTMDHVRLTAGLTKSNVAAQNEKFFDHAMRNLVTGDLTTPYEGMVYSNVLGDASEPKPFLKRLFSADDRPERIMPSSLEVEGQISPPELGYAQRFNELAQEDPEQLLGLLAINRANTNLNPTLLYDVRALPIDQRPGWLQEYSTALRNMPRNHYKQLLHRVPSANAYLKDLVTMDALQALSRDEDPTDAVFQYLPYLRHTFKRGGLANMRTVK